MTKTEAVDKLQEMVDKLDEAYDAIKDVRRSMVALRKDEEIWDMIDEEDTLEFNTVYQRLEHMSLLDDMERIEQMATHLDEMEEEEEE